MSFKTLKKFMKEVSNKDAAFKAGIKAFKETGQPEKAVALELTNKYPSIAAHIVASNCEKCAGTSTHFVTVAKKVYKISKKLNMSVEELFTAVEKENLYESSEPSEEMSFEKAHNMSDIQEIIKAFQDAGMTKEAEAMEVVSSNKHKFASVTKKYLPDSDLGTVTEVVQQLLVVADDTGITVEEMYDNAEPELPEPLRELFKALTDSLED